MKLVPLEKQSKKEQRKFHAGKSPDWNDLKTPIRVVNIKKVSDRKKLKKPDF